MLYDAVAVARDQGLDVVALAADRFSATSVRDIEATLALSQPLIEVLAGWPGDRPGIVFIDALDAARGGEGTEAFIQLLSEICQLDSRWRAVASIRTFDLRYRPELQRIFRGSPGGELVDPEFGTVRHLRVPPLNNRELAQLEQSAPTVATFLQGAPDALIELVRNPFNLARLAELLDLGVGQEELNTVATQLALLDVYWRERILTPAEGALARERVLRQLTEGAIRSLRLSVPRADLASLDAADQAVEELLHSGVLIEAAARGGSDIFALSHHLLFDYAAARLLLRREPGELIELLRDQPDLALIARPSLTLHFEWLWQTDREAYWELAIHVAGEPSLRLLVRLVGPAVAAERARSPQDLDPLVGALAGQPGLAARARQVLRHLIGARIAAGVDHRPLQGAPTGVWSEFAVKLVPLLGDTVDAVRILVWGLGEECDRLTTEDTQALGVAARGLLGFALAQDLPDLRSLREGIQAAAMTFDTDSEQTEILLRKLSDPGRIAEHGYAELFTLANAAASLHARAPAFVADLYEVAFSFSEESDEPVQLTTGVVGMTSTRRQDYNLGLHILANGFPDFLQAAPGGAVRALIGAGRSYARRHGLTDNERGLFEFEFRGQTAKVAEDYSLTWDSGPFVSDHEVELLDAFERRLDQLAELDDNEQIEMLVQAVAADEAPAAVWRRILRVTDRRPAAMAPMMTDALASPALLALSDTCELAARALIAARDRLESADQERIDEMVDGLPDAFDNRDEGEELADKLRAAIRGDLDVPSQTYPELISETDTSVGWLSAPVSGRDATTARRRFDELLAPVKALTVASAPPIEEIDWEDAASAIRRLDEALAHLDIAEHKLFEAAGLIAAACLRAAGREPLPDDATSRFAAEMLIRLADHPKPAVESSLHEFDQAGIWGSPAPRVEAAKGLLALGRTPGILDEFALAKIRQLASDPAAAVRKACASQLRWLVSTDLDLTWELAEQLHEDPSMLVQRELLRTVGLLATIDRDRALGLAASMHTREIQKPQPRTGLLEPLGGFLVELSVWTGAPHGEAILDRLSEDVPGRRHEWGHVLFRLRDATTVGETIGQDTHAEVRARAIRVFERLLGAALDAFDRIVSEGRTENGPLDLTPEQSERLRNTAEVIDTAATETHFASGSYIDPSEHPKPRLPEPKRRRFYHEAGGLLDLLVRIAWPAPAVHHVLETLQEQVSFDPHGVLIRVGTLVRSAREWGYPSDSLAQATFVEIVQTYLAQHRSLLTDSEARQALLDSLDAFVDAGWPAARRLVYRLDEVFR